MLQLVLERITARIAVSASARKVQVEHLGGDAWVIPNGVSVARYAARRSRCPAGPATAARSASSAGSPSRARASRCCWRRSSALSAQRPGLRLLVAGPGDPDEALADVPADVADRITFLGLVCEEEKARMLRSVDLYVAPNTGGESFGMILTEAMAAGTPVVASDLDAFRRVLDGGRAGALFPVGDVGRARAPSSASCSTTRPGGPSWPPGRARWSQTYDWPVVAQPGAGGLPPRDRGGAPDAAERAHR